jgi:hypothetical protein
MCACMYTKGEMINYKPHLAILRFLFVKYPIIILRIFFWFVFLHAFVRGYQSEGTKSFLGHVLGYGKCFWTKYLLYIASLIESVCRLMEGKLGFSIL